MGDPCLRFLMFIRKKLNESGSTSSQIIEKRGRRNVVVCSVGCSKDQERISQLEIKAQIKLDAFNSQLQFNFGHSEREKSALTLLNTGTIQSIGPELILGAIFDSIGFNAIPEELFREIDLARLTYPTS
jgi:hypothetical protein